MADVSKLPCCFTSYSAVQKEDILTKPSVDCQMECDHCGWNPKVKEARLERLYLDRPLLNKRKGEFKR